METATLTAGCRCGERIKRKAYDLEIKKEMQVNLKEA